MRNLDEEYLARAAQKLAGFLRRAKNPRAMREEAVMILEAQNLLMHPVNLEETNPVKFAEALIVENSLLRQAMSDLQFKLGPEGALNVEDLLLGLSPSRGD